jgi:mannosyltransferase OCH1-like enzyme
VIPRIIHQTWRDADLPAPLADMAETWRRHHPDWEWRLWTDADNRAFVAAHHPGFLAFYDAYPHPIQRVDAVRYLILQRLGGVFVDLDFEALRPIGPLLTGNCVFGQEPQENCAAHGRDLIVSNAFMAAAPRHPFMTALAEGLAHARPQTANPNTAILETTGPFYLTALHQAYRGPDPATILPAEAIFPLSVSQIEQLRIHGWTPDLVALRETAAAVHYHAGTWWR